MRWGSTAAPPWRLPGRLLVAALAAWTLGAECTGQNPYAVQPPQITLRINGIPDDLDDLLVLPTKRFVVDVSWQPGSYPVDPASFVMFARRWGGSDVVFDLPLKPDGTGAVGVLPPTLAVGTHTLRATVCDTRPECFHVEMAFAVRSLGASPPIGSGQQIWLDFESDRDAAPGPDFPVDLQFFGLGSALAPLVSGWVLEDVIALVVARVEEAYHDQPTNGLPGPDPVAVAFSSSDPGSGDVTHICVGGEAPNGGSTIGSIATDLKNANRTSVECGTLPPTGIFPRELLILEGEAAFQAVFDPLRPATGGVPAGEHPLDPTVLAPGFDPGVASPEELARYQLVLAAIEGFADMLGSIVAHEAGHALGLVPPGVPGGGLFGGTGGAELNHDVTPAGVSPAENFLMNAGNTFTFERLAGLNGNPLPYFRPIDYAYLRDRVVIDPAVNFLAYPPVAQTVTPSTITASGWTQIAVGGSGFLPPPVLRLLSPGYNYNVNSEALVSSSEVTGWVNKGQLPLGVYDLEAKNPDGQLSLLPAAITIATP
jgi:hypothetical protein